jgi:hypothetical protein
MRAAQEAGPRAAAWRAVGALQGMLGSWSAARYFDLRANPRRSLFTGSTYMM